MNDRLHAHIVEFRTHCGRLGGDFEGSPTLLLHHRGARSGIERVCPLGYQSVESGYAVFGTNWGKPEHPAWYHNVQANPETTIEVGAEVVSVRARVAGGEERDRIWERQTQLVPAMGDYGRRAGRTIPVVILEPT
jgi:deazaflavin-dependent oxidoreductase (nitroreductase family)